MLFASVTLLGISARADEAAAERYINRGCWTIISCSEAGTIEGAAGGYAKNILDDNLSTYFHQNWSSDHKAEPFHWLLIDMHNEQQVNGIDYWRRQNNTNGLFYNGKVYVTNNPPLLDNDNEAKTYYENEENVASGTYEWTYTGTADEMNAARRCTFASPATGRYILIIVANTGKGDDGRHACCAELKAFTTTTTTLEREFTESISSYKKGIAEGLNLMKAVIGGEALNVPVPADLTAENLSTKVTEAEAAYQTYIDKFNNKEINIKCAIRRDNAYLGVLPKGGSVVCNTSTPLIADHNWLILTQAEGIKLYNKTTGFYIGKDNAPTSNANNAQVIVPVAGKDGHIEFGKGITTTFNRLNVNTEGSNLTNYTANNDDGSQWDVTAAAGNYVDPVVSTADAPKYYRMVNARQMFNKAAPCFAAANENRDAVGLGAYPTVCRADDPAAYWRLEEGPNGAVKLVNLTGYSIDHDGTQTEITMAKEGKDCFLVKQTADEFGNITCYGLSNSANKGGGTYLDYNGGTAFRWTPTKNGAHGANGTLWYFLAADEAEATAAKNAYLTSLQTKFASSAMGNDIILANYLSSNPIFDTTKAVQAVESALPGSLSDYTEFPEQTLAANELIMATKGEYTSPVDWSEVLASAEGKYFYIKSRRVASSGHNHSYLTADFTATNNRTDLNNNLGNDPLRGVWTLEAAADGQFYVRHHGSRAYLSHEKNSAGWLVLTEEPAQAYTLHVSPTQLGFGFTTEGDENAIAQGVHVSANPHVCTWRLTNVAESWFDLIAIDDVVPVSIEKGTDIGEATITFGGSATTITSNPSTADRHKLTLTKVGEYTPTESGQRRIAAAEGTMEISREHVNGNTLALSNLENNTEYQLTVPAGFFTTSGKLSAPISYNFVVNDKGDVSTSIDEIESWCEPSEQTIYDLQGRRLAAPIRGINIINGRKVLIK